MSETQLIEANLAAPARIQAERQAASGKRQAVKRSSGQAEAA
jgi:hypothetical protein